MNRSRNEQISLRDYVDAMFTERDRAIQAALLSQEKAVTAALEAADKAVTKAEANAERWRENANEWRGAMSDRDRELPSRREVDAATVALSERLRLLEKLTEHGIGREAGIQLSAGVLAGSLTLFAAVIGTIIVLANVLTG